MSSTSDRLRGLDVEASEAERSRAEWVVQEAYADGQLEAGEFEARIGVTLTAVSRRELNEAVRGIRATARAALSEQAVRPSTIRVDAARDERHRSAVAHLSGVVLLGLGPLIAYAVSAPGSYERREAAKAFNFQIATAGVGIGAILPWGILWWAGQGPDQATVGFLVFLAVLCQWIAGSVAGAVGAAHGGDIKHPLMRLTRFELLREGPPRTLSDRDVEADPGDGPGPDHTLR